MNNSPAKKIAGIFLPRSFFYFVQHEIFFCFIGTPFVRYFRRLR